MKALDNRFVYDLQERKSKSMIAQHNLFCISRWPRLQKIKGSCGFRFKYLNCVALLQIFITYRQDVSDLRTKNLLTNFFKLMLIFIQECHTFQYSTINGHESTQSCQHNTFTTINLNVRTSLNLQIKEKF